ncbi:AraC family transcriptional regulator [Yinghuangia seranimata]|uniref:AraC family transcriptional regulator n=1 Tax=Yinghuangia seranimata TaxID=408067 RepID=UPI00248CF8E1|nr:AraC family transcriptional regulator [Yinghuangia seranimata]MDI2125749.1 AraC family transcriptional regulator [Yinghuangia seranimata]
MDVLSDIITAMRTGEPRAARVEWFAPWGQRFRQGPGAGFIVVVEGPCVLLTNGDPPRRLGVGDVVFMPHGGGHALADSASSPLAEPSCGPTGAAERNTGTDTYDGEGVGVGTVNGDDGRPRFETRYAAPPVGRRPDPAGPAATTVTLCGAYHLDRTHAHPLLDALPAVVHLPARLGTPRPELRAAVDLLAAELDAPRSGADVVVPALLDTLLVYVLRAWFAAAPSASAEAAGWAAALTDPVVAAALDALHHEPGRPWTVESLGARAGLSRAAFARRFTGLVGRPPLAYLTWWRMTLAARLLRDSAAPLSSVAEQVGYTSEFAFATAFKRQFGQAPGRYRRGA